MKFENQGREKRLASALRWLISLVVIAALISVTFFAFSYYVELSHARNALYQAKTVKLAAWVVATECYGKGSSFYDMGSESGFADGVYDEIVELSQCSGTVRLLRTKNNGYGIAEMSYTQNEFTVHYEFDGESEQWQVYKKSTYITA